MDLVQVGDGRRSAPLGSPVTKPLETDSDMLSPVLVRFRSLPWPELILVHKAGSQRLQKPLSQGMRTSKLGQMLPDCAIPSA